MGSQHWFTASVPLILSVSYTTTRRNFSLATRYSLKFTRCSLLVVKSLVTRCRSYSLQNFTRYSLQKLLVEKNLLVTRCKIRSLLIAGIARCKKSLDTRFKIRSLLVAKVVPCKKSLVTRLQNLLVTRCNKSLVTRCKILFIIS